MPPDREPAPVSPDVLVGANRGDRHPIRSVPQAEVILMYGAHLLRNGAALLLTRLMEQGWITHLATNGAGTIHDWEYALQDARDRRASRTTSPPEPFGTWDETGEHPPGPAGSAASRGWGRRSPALHH